MKQHSWIRLLLFAAPISLSQSLSVHKPSTSIRPLRVTSDHDRLRIANHLSNPSSSEPSFFPLQMTSTSSSGFSRKKFPDSSPKDRDDANAERSAMQSLVSPLMVLWRFTRPHTIIGSATAIPALHFLAAPTYAAAFSVASMLSMVYAMVPSLLMNLYITGLNQVTDVEIDKINKPNLPIAAGDLSLRNGIIIVIASLLLSLGMGAWHPTLGSPGLNMTLWFSGILGTIYSLPPFRLKRFPFLAAFCIVAV